MTIEEIQDPEYVYFLHVYGMNGYPSVKKFFPTKNDAFDYFLTLPKTPLHDSYEARMRYDPDFHCNEVKESFRILKIDISKLPRYRKMFLEKDPKKLNG